MNVCRDTVQRERVQETVSGIHTRVVFGCGELVIFASDFVKGEADRFC